MKKKNKKKFSAAQVPEKINEQPKKQVRPGEIPAGPCRPRVSVGEEVTVFPITLNSTPGGAVPMGESSSVRARKGTVVYVHPEERYYTVEFKCRSGKVRESFKMGCVR